MNKYPPGEVAGVRASGASMGAYHLLVLGRDGRVLLREFVLEPGEPLLKVLQRPAVGGGEGADHTGLTRGDNEFRPGDQKHRRCDEGEAKAGGDGGGQGHGGPGGWRTGGAIIAGKGLWLVVGGAEALLQPPLISPSIAQKSARIEGRADDRQAPFDTQRTMSAATQGETI